MSDDLHNHGWEVLDHTADIGLKADGETLDEVFTLAAEGMFNIICPSPKREVGEIDIEMEADDHGMLLVEFLTELLFLFDTQQTLFSRFELHVENYKIYAKCIGETYDEERHEIDSVIKAVTYHMLEVDENHVQVLFDI